MDISELVSKQREFFMRGETPEHSFRLAALRRLSAAITEMEPEIAAALASDLNKSETEGYITEIGQVQGELRYVLRNLSQWMKGERVKRPLCSFPFPVPVSRKVLL